jgi:hypothetical protein
MSLSTRAAIASSQPIRDRVVACALQEGAPGDRAASWAALNIGALIGDDWVAAWESALAADPDADPGANDLVVTDQMILSAVQHQISLPNWR